MPAFPQMKMLRGQNTGHSALLRRKAGFADQGQWVKNFVKKFEL